ncbi:hypothetical protein [uncultured Oxalicibacterium sp.]|uniref:hypothetical protein n=1 Tax=uncultured Oxalicibacterium sp. TaxID=1168540 RepID=UPI0025E167A0|nr:hypothetical protein [uncultured Oxalicibacterium sp.]
MNKTTKLFSALAFASLALPVLAQTSGSEVQRDVNQQQRIENGLQSGQLTTREAAKLERKEAHVDQAQSRALRDGTLSNAEKARIQHMQNDVSRDIRAEKHDAQVGNPDSASSRRMQADVQRNINQEKRIEAGVKNGSLTNHEVSKLERGQAKAQRKQFRAGRDGHVGAAEQKRLKRVEDRNSHRIHHEKHDAQVRG